MDIKIYSTETCSFCKMAKEYFKSKDLEYTEYNVATDAEKQKEMMELTGAMSVPVIVINSEVVQGFDKPKIEHLLDMAEKGNMPTA